ncbi:MAG TPA: hypothetical protein VHX17_02585 [Candidatus Cybelea sp.]|jgi:hypothetical protein|nr:hypothetical protein [Candidatus Cybelea sp.]
MKNTLKPNSVTVQRLRAAADKVAPNRGAKPTEAPKDGAGTLLQRAKAASAEARRLLDR